MEFKCKYSDSPYGYACKVKKIVRDSSASTAHIFTGDHLSGKTNDDVKLFWIGNQPLGAIPKNLGEKFPNLMCLVIKRCGLKKIWKTDLVGLENLEQLILDGNDLPSLPNDLFADMKKLRSVTFYGNRLERLNAKLYMPIEDSFESEWLVGNAKIYDWFDGYDGNGNLKRLMDLIDRLEALLVETGLQSKSLRNTNRKPIKGIDWHEHHHKQVITKFAEFKASGKFTDVTITIRGKEFKLHRNILAALSPKWEQIFTQTMFKKISHRKTPTNVNAESELLLEKVQNFSHESFQSFLDFFYTGQLDVEANTLEIFELASVFEVTTLEAICTDKITADLSPANALEAYNLAHHHNSDQLKQTAFKAIQEMIPELPSRMVDQADQVNKIVNAKHDFEMMVKETVKQCDLSKNIELKVETVKQFDLSKNIELEVANNANVSKTSSASIFGASHLPSGPQLFGSVASSAVSIAPSASSFGASHPPLGSQLFGSSFSGLSSSTSASASLSRTPRFQ